MKYCGRAAVFCRWEPIFSSEQPLRELLADFVGIIEIYLEKLLIAMVWEWDLMTFVIYYTHWFLLIIVLSDFLFSTMVLLAEK